MTETILGRPRRTRPTDRVNYKLDSEIRKLLAQIAEQEGRNEGSQVEQLVLFYAAFQRLNSEGTEITLGSVNVKINEIRKEVSGDQSI